MLTLNDGRSELWQWDTGRKLNVDADCSQVHFSNKVFGRSIDVDVVDGVAVIPDILLQSEKDFVAWAFVGTAENGYTKISKVFKVNRKNKPADYVFTPPEQTTLAEIMERLDDIESAQDPDAIKNAVDDYLANNPIQIDEKDPTVPAWAKQATKPKYTATEVGAVATVNSVKPDANGNVEITIQGSGGNVALTAAQISALDGMFKVCAFTEADVSTEYSAFKAAFGIEDSGGGEEEPDTPVTPTVTLTSISATYTGGDVVAGTAVTALTGIVVTAHYSDGTSKTVTGYTLSGTIAEGNNTVTVSYGGKTTTFVVVGVAESGGEETQKGIHQTNADAILVLPYSPSDGVDKVVWTLDNSGDPASIGVWLSVAGSNSDFLGNRINSLVNGTYDKTIEDVRKGKTTITCVPTLASTLTGKYQINHSGYDYAMTWYNIKFYNGDTLMMDISPKSATEMLDAVTGETYTFTGDTSVLSLVEG